MFIFKNKGSIKNIRNRGRPNVFLKLFCIIINNNTKQCVMIKLIHFFFLTG